MWQTLWSRGRQTLLDLFYPPRCPLCSSFAADRCEACPDCRARLSPLQGDAVFDLARTVHLARGVSCFSFEEPVRSALHRLKYTAARESLRYFANQMVSRAMLLGAFDAILFVPMTRSRIVGRGFNPAALLAARIAKIAKMPLNRTALVRVHDGRPQAELDRGARLHNVRGAFEVPCRARGGLRGQRLLLIDDVMTTGSTVNECARALRSAGAAEVVALTVARTL